MPDTQTTHATAPSEQDRERISEFFFGSPNMSWETAIQTYNDLERQVKHGYPWERSAASDTLAWFNDEAKDHLLYQEMILAEQEQEKK